MSVLQNHKNKKKKENIKWKVWSNLIIKKKNEKNLTIRKFLKKRRKFKPYHQEEHTEFGSG
jgi:hypothetical protein